MHIVESSTTLTYVRSVSFGLVGDIWDSNGAPVVVLPSIRSLASLGLGLGLGLARPDSWRGESGVVVGVDSSESALVFLASGVLQPRVSTVEGRGPSGRACFSDVESFACWLLLPAQGKAERGTCTALP